MFKSKSIPTLMLFSGLMSCGSSDTTNTVVADDTSESDTVEVSEGYYDADMFTVLPLSEDTVSCTLENGTSTTCYELTFAANTVGDTEGEGTIGPYCPDSITTPRNEAGLGVYDGATNPGFQSLVDAAQGMDADGYDIIDEDGNIRSGGGGAYSYCLSMPFDSSLTITYLIPTSPEFRSEAYYIETVGSIGVGINGIPIKGDPPSVTTAEAGIGGTGSGNIPALDHCGGHADPAGYYHWHFIPQSINTVFESQEYDFTDLYGISCTNFHIEYEDPTAFAGLAKDGFPIYGAYDDLDSISTVPSESAEVDECNGHTHATPEFPDGVYHYHALETGAPNVPVCLMGSFVDRNDFTVQ
ncbi:YHYH protein [Paraglaciecola sp. 2405UD69-4]|uniref:YHYH protein n=1 Tax=Paraglaciecola sp. 2405UD69-4 TaxID=3391836 RepID=UPI0039C97B4A